jgi:hypothetical protein
MLNIFVLVNLSGFAYVQIISMMLWNYAWMKSVELIFKVFECVLWLRFKLCKVEW